MTFKTLLPNLAFFLFADDTNILYADKHLRSLESVINSEHANVLEWLLNTQQINAEHKKIQLCYFPSSTKSILNVPA